MLFTATPIAGAFLLELDRMQDERGFFARIACEKEFRAVGLNSIFKQCNMQYNVRKGTLRGMHIQNPPHAEEKLVRCTRGAIFDVIVDLRQDSNTYKQWYGVELSQENRRLLYVPKGAAHGYMTLLDDTEAFYMVTEFYSPDCEWGVRFDDPEFGIAWPKIEPLIVSDKDWAWPLVEKI